MQDSLRALTAHSTAARCAMKKPPNQEILASNNLKGKRRTITTRPNPILVRAKCAFCYLIFASNEGTYGRNGAPFCTSYLGDTEDLIFRNGAGALHHARTDDRQDMSWCPKCYAHRVLRATSLMGGWNMSGLEWISGSVDQWWKAHPRRSRGQTQATRGANDRPQGQLACLVLLPAC
jgi:hypothetical protein